MILLNDSKFAENEKEFRDSLFMTGGTCVGYAKRLKRSVKLFNAQNKLVGVINKNGVLCCATPVKDGKVWYSFADVADIGKYGMTKKREDVLNLAVDHDETGYIYK